MKNCMVNTRLDRMHSNFISCLISLAVYAMMNYPVITYWSLMSKYTEMEQSRQTFSSDVIEYSYF